MKWLDIEDIAISLQDKYPDRDNVNLRYTDLQKWICELEDFNDNKDACNEKILQAIQMAWIDERE